MKHPLSLLTLVMTGLLSPGIAEAVSVCVLGNEAVLISSQSKRVLIDGLYREGFPEDIILAEDLRERMETAVGEFERLDLVLITHIHKDHFDAAAVVRHFANNPAATLISTPDVIAEMVNDIPENRRLNAPMTEGPVTFDAGGIEITVFTLTHGANNKTQNLGFLFALDGKTILHMGDTSADGSELKAAGVADYAVDVALVPFWYFLSPDNAKELGSALKAETIIPIHMPRPDADKQYLRRNGGFEGLQEVIGKRGANIVQFEGGVGCLANLE